MRLRVILCALALLAPAACSGDGDPVLPAPGGPAVKATLQATPVRTDELLTWNYTLRNDESTPIAVVNGASGDDEPGSPPATWIVARHGDDTTVEVSQRLFGPPPDVDLARYFDQYGTVLAPGRQLRGTARVTLPITAVQHPYRSAFRPPLSLPDDPARAVFCVGVARSADLPGEPVPAGPGPAGTVRYTHSQAAADRQYLICSAPLDLG